MDHYAVMGNPVQHSKSPVIHQLFAEQTKQQLVYTAINVELDSFPDAVNAFQDAGGKGLNITVPFKQQAYALMSAVSERAALAKAVNTIKFNAAGERFGDNTDGVGLVRDITQNHSYEISGKQVLLLGAGGAVRGVLGPLLAEKPQTVTIANRTVSKAQELGKEFSHLGSINAVGFSELTDGQFDVIINGTSASLHSELPDLPPQILEPAALCYDMMYGKEPTVFLRWAKQQGASLCVDGLGMLVEQAAEAFFLWRNVRPETLPVITYLKKQL